MRKTKRKAAAVQLTGSSNKLNLSPPFPNVDKLSSISAVINGAVQRC